MQTTDSRQQRTTIDARALAQGIVDAVREPFLILDKELRVVAASRSFYSETEIGSVGSQDGLLHALGHELWDIPKFRALLGKVMPQPGVTAGYEVKHEFSGLGHRTTCLYARPVLYEERAGTVAPFCTEAPSNVLVLEHEKDSLLREREVLLQELKHRIANGLQIIASIILMKARTVQSEETRVHLNDAYKRVISMAAVQTQLHACGGTGAVEVTPYLSKLCATLATSMIDDNRPVSLNVFGGGGSAAPRQAECLGLIVTELVMNALKHAFLDHNTEGRITVTYDVVGTSWKLSVSDNGIGKPHGAFVQEKAGLGTGIVKALSRQLNAKVETKADSKGTTVSIRHDICHVETTPAE